MRLTDRIKELTSSIDLPPRLLSVPWSVFRGSSSIVRFRYAASFTRMKKATYNMMAFPIDIQTKYIKLNRKCTQIDSSLVTRLYLDHLNGYLCMVLTLIWLWTCLLLFIFIFIFVQRMQVSKKKGRSIVLRRL